MKIKIISIVFLALSTSLFAQQKTILVYDLATGTLDSLPNITYDETITSDQTPYFIGNYNGEIGSLPQTAPTSNTYPNTEYTLKKRVTDDFDITKYPIRTSVKTFFVENDTLQNNCTASMISRKHVLTSVHCLLNNADSIIVDSMLICPIYNNGEFSSAFGCSEVEKIYFFKDSESSLENFAVLELSDPIGAQTGWISVGFNDSDDFFTEGIYFRFSYPNVRFLPMDPTEYNGDTLYYGYGKLDIINDVFFGTDNATGIAGEGGASIIHVENNAVYTSYGVLTYGSFLRSDRIRNSVFYSIQSIIENDLITDTDSPENEARLSLFPNPTTGKLYLENADIAQIESAFISDYSGRIVRYISNAELTSGIDISLLPNATYQLFITTKNDVFSEKIIKIGK